MVAPLYNLALVEHTDLVGIAEGREASGLRSTGYGTLCYGLLQGLTVGNGCCDELGTVEREGIVVVEFRLFLWQHKGFSRHTSRWVKAGDEGTCPKTIHPLTAQHNPTARRAPRWIAIYILAVHLRKATDVAAGGIEQKDLTLGMPDGEITIIRLHKEYVASIGRNTRERDRFSLF